jgi:hypothetical protein
MRGACWPLMLGFADSTIALPAAVQEYPFCIKGCDFGAGRGDCSLTSYQQRLAMASGREAHCAANPYFNANAGHPNAGSHRSRGRFQCVFWL